MNKKEEIIKALFAEKFGETDEIVAQTISKIINLEIGNSNEDDETRSIDIVEDSDGKITAKSFKLYNIMKVSNYDLGKLLIEETTLALVEDTRLKITLGLIKMLYEFYPKLTYAFNDTDAKILLTIYQLQKKSITPPEVYDTYLQNFTTSVSTAQIERSLNFLKDMRVLKYLGNGNFEVREKMTYERN